MKLQSLLLTFLFLCGCSRTDLAFHYADTFIAYEIKDQFDFAGSGVEKISTQFVQDIRVEFLPQLVSEMQKVQTEYELKRSENSTPEKWSQWIFGKTLDFRNLGYKSIHLLDRQSVSFSGLMKLKNWEDFKKNFEKKNKKILKQKPESRLITTLEDFLGSFNPQQEALLNDFLKKYPVDPSDRVANRVTTLGQFEARMGEFSTENFQKAASHFLKNPQEYGDPLVQEKIKARTLALSETLGQFLQTLTPQQEKKLKKNWNKYLNDFSEIHRKAVQP